MGLKSGSRDAGLDETEAEDNPERENDDKQPTEQQLTNTGPAPSETENHDQEPTTEPEESTTAHTESDSDSNSEQGGQRPSMSSIPYKLRREKVNEGREQVPFFLREDVINAEDELKDTLEEMLGGTVYKSDYREAAMIVAQRNPDLIAEVLREWGYDLEA